MLNVAILGYGNLGKALEKLIDNDSDTNLVGVFSRRNISHPKYFPSSSITTFCNKIDVVAICQASIDETTKSAISLASNFCTVDTFDNHTLIDGYKMQLNSIAQQHKTCCILSAGWDPGILSMIRAILEGTVGNAVTFWGKGVSQGHTNALKKVEGVLDGIQFTLPNNKAVKLACKGQNVAGYPLHKRLCLIHTKVNRGDIRQKICSIPHYFYGQPTTVKFVSKKQVEKAKRQMYHKGQVVASNGISKAKFTLSTLSNPLLTAKIMLKYAKIAHKLSIEGKFGAFDCLDIPLRYLTDKSVL